MDPDTIVALIDEFLDAMPEIVLDRTHPELATVDISEETNHAYILRSLGNFLDEYENQKGDG